MLYDREELIREAALNWRRMKKLKELVEGRGLYVHDENTDTSVGIRRMEDFDRLIGLTGPDAD